MRRVVNSTFVSLDGVVNHMEHWHFDYIDEQIEEITLGEIDASDAMLMGRKTYDIYAGAWPEREGAYPERINAIQKYVASTTLDKGDWNNTTVIKDDLVGTVTRLKQEPGKDILMHGYGPVAATLLRHGLLDELHLWVHPKLAGVGTTEDMVFTEGLQTAFELLDAKALRSGVVLLTYQVKKADTQQ